MTPARRHSARYPVLVGLLWALALGLGLQPIGSALALPQLNWIGPLVDRPPHASATYLIATTTVALVAAMLIYLLGLDRLARCRSTLLVVLNAAAPGAVLGAGLTGWTLGNAADPDPIMLALAGAALVGPPLLLLLLEWAFASAARAAGLKAEEVQWRGLARRAYGLALLWRPGQPDIVRRWGMLLAWNDDVERALAALERLAPIAKTNDAPRLRQMEQGYRSLGRLQAALSCLLRLRELEPENAPKLNERILDDMMRLGMEDEAFEMLESGELRETTERLRLRQRLSVSRGNFAQAIGQINRIADREGTPYGQAIALCRDLVALLPDHVEVRVMLGELLLDSEVAAQRAEGVALLEAIIEADPHRKHLCHRALEYYREMRHDEKVEEHLGLLIDSNDMDPEVYLDYARRLEREDRHQDALEVIKAMLELMPGDVRGLARLARIRLKMDQVDEAAAALERAEALEPGDEASLLESLRREIDQRRRGTRIEQVRRELEAQPGQAQLRLELIELLIERDAIDAVLEQSDLLLEDHPELESRVEALMLAGLGRVERGFRLRDYLCDIYMKNGRYDDLFEQIQRMAEGSLSPNEIMIKGCRRLLEQAPDHLPARQALTRAYHASGNWEKVLETLDPLLEDSPERASAEDQALWVEAASRLERHEDAIRLGVPLAEAHGGDKKFLTMLVDLLEQAEDFAQALQVVNIGMQSLPDDEDLSYLNYRLTKRLNKQRLAELSRILAEEGELSCKEHLEKADLHREMGDINEAIIHFQRAAEEEQIALLALAKMAESLSERGMFDLADETLDKLPVDRASIEAMPEIMNHIYSVARELERVKQPERAIKYYKRLFRLDAGFADVVRRLERLS